MSRLKAANKTILIAEDETVTREAVAEFLSENGYNVIQAKNGLEVLKCYKQAALIVLDIMMPECDGLETLKEIRKKSDVPILILTALSDVGTELSVFNEFADDYMNKPFSLMVLLRRIEAILRRTPLQQLNIYKNGTINVNFDTYTAHLNDETVALTVKEIKILKLLIENEGKALTREYILDAIWGNEGYPFDRVVDVYIKNLRKKLKLNEIKTVKGIGYLFETI